MAVPSPEECLSPANASPSSSPRCLVISVAWHEGRGAKFVCLILRHIDSKFEKIKFLCSSKLNKGVRLRPELAD